MRRGEAQDGSGTALGKLPANLAGLYNMTDHGFEWVQGWYEESFTAGDASNPLGSKKGTAKVIRGNDSRGGDSLAFVAMTFLPIPASALALTGMMWRS